MFHRDTETFYLRWGGVEEQRGEAQRWSTQQGHSLKSKGSKLVFHQVQCERTDPVLWILSVLMANPNWGSSFSTQRRCDTSAGSQTLCLNNWRDELVSIHLVGITLECGSSAPGASWSVQSYIVIPRRTWQPPCTVGWLLSTPCLKAATTSFKNNKQLAVAS